ARARHDRKLPAASAGQKLVGLLLDPSPTHDIVNRVALLRKGLQLVLTDVPDVADDVGRDLALGIDSNRFLVEDDPFRRAELVLELAFEVAGYVPQRDSPFRRLLGVNLFQLIRGFVQVLPDLTESIVFVPTSPQIFRSDPDRL